MQENTKFKITFGGWYQRTTLHLSEIYDLFDRGVSQLDLDKQRLLELQKSLDLKDVSREAGDLEFVRAHTNSGVEVRYYEDGLYILEIESDDIKKSQQVLTDYYDNILSPAISYIFSLGAPTPKILANIKTVHPTVVSVTVDQPEEFKIDTNEFGPTYSTIDSEKIMVHKTPQYIFIISKPDYGRESRELVEMQIFFREFKDQLEKYLNIHRRIWEEISDIKEQKTIAGKDVENIRSKLDSYQKTISLISNRINQMGSYIRTRASIAKSIKIEDQLRELFQFKFEVLTDTLDYIKEIWKMTNDYLGSAIQYVVEIKNQGTTRGIQSLQLITSIGVVSGLIGYFARTEWPRFTTMGAIYLVLIILATWILNSAMVKIYKNKKYRIKFTERTEDL